MKEATLVVVGEYNTSTEAEITRSILQSAGIKSEIRNEFMSSYGIGAIPAQVVVREEDLKHAQELLRHR